MHGAVDIAVDAGKAILDVYESDFAVEHKDDKSPVTAADHAAHAVIIARLAQMTPDIPRLSEESGLPDFAIRRTWESYWLIDPLDGTKEFIKRNGEFTVNIALIEDHIPALGIVAVPAKDVVYYGCRGAGAWRREGAAAPRRIAVSPLKAAPLRVVGSRSHASPSLAAYADKLGEHELVSMGSSLKLCLVAEGAADVYPRLGPTSEWDTAAAQAIVECAGGTVVDVSGAPLRYNTKADILNPHFLVYGDASRDWTSYL
jgi:3'(2'), 5'-bisphosphate nucleotidase